MDFSRRRLLARAAAYGLALAALIAAVPAAQAEIWRFRLDVTPRAPQPGSAASMHCTENVICFASLDLAIGGKRVPVTVDVLFVPGYAYVRFEAAGGPLLIGGQRSLALSLGPSGRRSATVTVNEPAPQSATDSISPLVSRPVLRGPGAYVATFDIEVRPDD